MDKDLAKEVGLTSEESLPAINYIEECMEVYQETLRASGVFPEEPEAQAVDNSKVEYANSPNTDVQYAHLSENY